jgi:hypothetical protein
MRRRMLAIEGIVLVVVCARYALLERPSGLQLGSTSVQQDLQLRTLAPSKVLFGESEPSTILPSNPYRADGCL